MTSDTGAIQLCEKLGIIGNVNSFGPVGCGFVDSRILKQKKPLLSPDLNFFELHPDSNSFVTAAMAAASQNAEVLQPQI